MGIRKEADRLLYELGLLKLLERHGKVYVVGSYRTDLMTHNDLDIDIEGNDHSIEGVFALAADVNALLKPYRFEGMAAAKGDKFFYGCETGITGERWNLDIWFQKGTDIIRSNAYCENIGRRIAADPALKDAIMEIKRELIKLKLYGIDKMPDKHYHSDEIYSAVLDEGIITFEEFMRKHLK